MLSLFQDFPENANYALWRELLANDIVHNHFSKELSDSVCCSISVFGRWISCSTRGTPDRDGSTSARKNGLKSFCLTDKFNGISYENRIWEGITWCAFSRREICFRCWWRIYGNDASSTIHSQRTENRMFYCSNYEKYNFFSPIKRRKLKNTDLS